MAEELVPTGRGTTGPVTAVAHRGDPYRERENTLASIRSALAAGADAVEVDVRTTADGTAVLLHDATLERLWGIDRPLARVHDTELPPGIPTLGDALAAADGTRLLIDLPDPAAARAAVAAVTGSGARDRVSYTGSPASMYAVRTVDDTAELALTWTRTAPIRPTLLTDLRPAWLNYRFGVLDRPRVQAARHAGYRVAAWTPDTRHTMRRLIGMGVQSITTNRVDVLHHVLRR